MKIVSSEEERQHAYYVRHTVFVGEQNVPPELEIDDLEEQATHFVLYNSEITPLGAGRCRQVNESLKAERICVLKEFRKTGAGELIMNKIEELAKEQGIKKVKLSSQTHAERFYQKLGYERVSDNIYMDAGIPHVDMVKQIK